jgi:hypothetical protein
VLVAPADKRAAVVRYAAPAIVTTLAISAAMNGFAFAARADGLLVYPAIGLGLAIPALIYALMKVAATLWIGHADNAAGFYVKMPASRCAQLIRQALEGNSAAIKKLLDNPDFCRE